MTKTIKAPKKKYTYPPAIGWNLFKIFLFNRLAILYLGFPILAYLNAGGGDARIFWIASTLLSLSLYSFFIAYGDPTASVQNEFLETKTFQRLRLPGLILFVFGLGSGALLLFEPIRFELPEDSTAYLGLSDTYQPLLNREKKNFPLMSIERIETRPGRHWKNPFHRVIVQKKNQKFVFNKKLKLTSGDARDIRFSVKLCIKSDFNTQFYVERKTAFGKEDIENLTDEAFSDFTHEFSARDVTQLKIPLFLTWISNKIRTNLPENVELNLVENDE